MRHAALLVAALLLVFSCDPAPPATYVCSSDDDCALGFVCSESNEPWGGDAINPAGELNLGRRADGNAARYFGCALDELRVASAARSAAWVETEYENQVDPRAFLAVVASEACVP